MKKLIIALVLIALPISLFAQFYIGPTAFFKCDPSSVSVADIQLDNFAFGLDTKIQLSIFEIQGTALYNFGQQFNVFLDAGIVLDIAIVSIGAGVGPNFLINLDPSALEAFGLGFNGKVHVDLNIDIIKISLYYVFLIDNLLDPATIADNMYFGNVGLSLLFKL